MRRGLVGVGMLLSLSGCPSTNGVDDAAASPDAGSLPDAFVPPDAYVPLDTPRGPDAWAPDAFVSDSGLGPDARDAARGDSATDVGPAPSELTFVLGDYDLPSLPGGPTFDEAPGLNLDGRVSLDGSGSTCEDYTIDLRSPRGDVGVDNQLVASLASLFESLFGSGTLEEQLDGDVASGERLIAVQVRDLDDWIDDTSVTVDLFLVAPEGCADVCAPDGGVVSVEGRWIRRGEVIASDLDGEIVDGRLRVAIESFPMSFPSGGPAPLVLTIRRAILEADVTPTALEGGVIAGGFVLEETVDALERIMPGIGETARGILRDYADLKPSATDPTYCDELSAGMGFTAPRGTVD